MNLIFSLLTLTSVALVHAQQGEKGNSIIPFPRVGRSGNSMSPGLIPFPRIGKRQLIPFPRVGKRAFWHLPMESSYYTEYEDLSPMIDSTTGGFLPSASFPVEVPSTMQDESDMEKRGGTPNASGGMWFGPRLGKRRKRSTDSAALDSTEHHDTLDMKPLLKMLHNSNWAIIVPVKERRNFTPRLGRRSSHDAVTIHQRSQPFSPRLGRSGETPLGSSNEHELDADDEVQTSTHYQRRDSTPENPSDLRGPPFSPRMGRDPFSPRLGRSDPFSPRLGRSGPSGDDRD